MAVIQRKGDGLEFDRAAFFADAVYAIAMTLIVVGIEIPKIADPNSVDGLLEAVDGASTSIIMFFVAFFVIGQYWLAHHRFVASLGSIDDRYLQVQLIYLAFVAFLPFPAQLMGDYVDNPVGVAALALGMAAVSGLELVLLLLAQRRGLLRSPPSAEAFRLQVIATAAPMVLLLLSVPLAFVNPWLAVAAWFCNSPVGVWVDRRQRAQAAQATPTD